MFKQVWLRRFSRSVFILTSSGHVVRCSHFCNQKRWSSCYAFGWRRGIAVKVGHGRWKWPRSPIFERPGIWGRSHHFKWRPDPKPTSEINIVYEVQIPYMSIDRNPSFLPYLTRTRASLFLTGLKSKLDLPAFFLICWTIFENGLPTFSGMFILWHSLGNWVISVWKAKLTAVGYWIRLSKMPENRIARRVMMLQRQ